MNNDLVLFDVDERSESKSSEIHPTAVVHPSAQLGVGVTIGPHCVVGQWATLEDRVALHPGVIVEGRTTIGSRTVVHAYSTLGVMPQDLKFEGEPGELKIGPENSIRQYANLSLGTQGGGMVTTIGRRNLLMVNSHVAHDCQVGDNCILANGVSLGGHVQVGDYAVLGGHAAVHQFVHIGMGTMTAGGAMVVQDVPPFVMVHGDRAVPSGLNVVGLRRSGVKADLLRQIKDMYRLLYKENLTVEACVERIEAEVPNSQHKELFVAFLKASSRGVCR